MKIIKKLYIIILLFLFFAINNNEIHASPLNDFEINMNINDSNSDNPKATIQGTGKAIEEANKDNFFSNIIKEYSSIIVGVFGIGTLTCVSMFIINFIKLGSSAGNPMERNRVLGSLLWTGISSALLGGICLFVFFTYGLGKGM